MHIQDIAKSIPPQIGELLEKEGIQELRPAQQKAVDAGLLNGNNLLICTPTASGKTLIAELAATKTILEKHCKAIYIVPLIALANEKYKEFKRKYNGLMNVAVATGDLDSEEPRLNDADFIICTAEKLDSLLRHHTSWINKVNCVIVDEIHLLNDVSRGPTLEIIITLLRTMLKVQLIGLSATIGNPQELAQWLEAELVQDSWRPVQLYEGLYSEGEIKFVKRSEKK